MRNKGERRINKLNKFIFNEKKKNKNEIYQSSLIEFTFTYLTVKLCKNKNILMIYACQNLDKCNVHMY